VTVSKELSKCKLNLVGVHEIRWEGGGTEPAGEYTFFFMERGKKIMNWVQVFVHKVIISAVESDDYVSDRMSYIILRGRWCHIIVLNVRTLTED
jgi:hypothetical protein